MALARRLAAQQPSPAWASARLASSAVPSDTTVLSTSFAGKLGNELDVDGHILVELRPELRGQTRRHRIAFALRCRDQAEQQPVFFLLNQLRDGRPGPA